MLALKRSLLNREQIHKCSEGHGFIISVCSLCGIILLNITVRYFTSLMKGMFHPFSVR
jgi:hypothetical protein